MVRRMLSGTALAALVVIAIQTPVSAGPPTRTEASINLTGPHFLSGICGFEILHTGTLHETATTFSDGRTIVHIQVDATLSANRKEAYENANFTVVIDPDTGTLAITGTVVNIHASGEGILVQDLGRIVRDLPTGDMISLAGRWMLPEGDTEEVCAYFADV
ncbi:MAG TPA: hypothetical protein VF148_13160 [Acidimicrobiia bacterium]